MTIIAAGAGDLDTVRRLFGACAAALPFSLDYQGFDAELAGLPSPYVDPRGCLLLAMHDGAASGIVAVRPLAPGIAELKRLYVVPAARGQGLGRRLAERAVAEASARRYRRIRLDTHRPSMGAAMRLYEALGFAEIPPYGLPADGDFAFFEKPL